MDMLKFLEDLYFYCKKNDIDFKNLSIDKQKTVIRRMLKYICRFSSQYKF